MVPGGQGRPEVKAKSERRKCKNLSAPFGAEVIVEICTECQTENVCRHFWVPRKKGGKRFF